jgi:hypothetical protein
VAKLLKRLCGNTKKVYLYYLIKYHLDSVMPVREASIFQPTECPLNKLFSISDLPGFRVRPENEVPGFRVRAQDFVPGFTLTENGVPSQQGSWADGSQPGWTQQNPELAEALTAPGIGFPAPGSGELVQRTPREYPDWLYKLLTMPLPSVSRVLDPRTGQRIVPYEPLINLIRSDQMADQNVRGTEDARAYVPGISALPLQGSVEAPTTEQRPSLNTPARPADIYARSSAAIAPNANPRPAAQEALSNAWRQPLQNDQPNAQAGNPQDPWRAEMAPEARAVPSTLSVNAAPGSNDMLANADDDGEQQAPRQRRLPQDQQTQQKILATPPGTSLATTLPPPPIGAPLIKPSVYSPSNDASNDSLFQLVGVKENRSQGLAAEAAHADAIIRADPEAKMVQQVRIYAEGAPSYMVADIVFSGNGVSALAIVEVKSGAGELSPKQIAALGEAARTGKIYIVSEDAAEKLKIKPNVTFAAQHILPLVSVVGGNQEAITRQLRNQGLEVLPEGVGRGGRPARLRIGAPPS